MKVRTNLNAGNIVNDTFQQAKEAANSSVGYLLGVRQGVLNFAQDKVDNARQVWKAVANL